MLELSRLFVELIINFIGRDLEATFALGLRSR